MYLPVILVREMGILGWVVFAVPNVIGAAAMGWVIGSPQASAALVERHRPACTLFSIVTVAFHAFFVIWLLPQVSALGNASVILALVAAAVVYGPAQRRLRASGQADTHPVDWSLAAAAVVYAISLAAAGVWLATVGIPAPPSAPSDGAPRAMALAPVCAFGFLLCPYLDLTFHRARMSCGRGGARWAFTLGFGGFFLAMIAFTLCYAPTLLDMPRAHGYGTPLHVALVALSIHMAVQSGLTVAFHARCMAPLRGQWRWLVWMAVAISVLAGMWSIASRHGLAADRGEFVYRCFMGFYGLIFPAYVWLLMVPPVPRMRLGMGLWLAAVALAMPFFWMGFVEGRTIWLLPGLGAVLLCKLVAMWPSPLHRAQPERGA